MFKKMKYIIPIVIMLIIVYPMIKNTEKELDIYLDEFLRTTDDIIKIDYSDGGAYVFKNFSEEANVCFFIKKSYFGWTYDYDVHAGSLGPLIEQSGFSITYLPKDRHVDDPVYFGKILDEEINRITFKNTKTNLLKDASITIIDNSKLWTVYVNDIEMDQFIISTYSKDNVLISEVEISLEEIKYTYYKNIKKGVRLKTLTR